MVCSIYNIFEMEEVKVPHLIFSTIFCFYNYTALSCNNCFIHPDDRSTIKSVW